MQHGPITHAGGSSRIRRIEKSLDLVAVQVVNQASVKALRRNRVHLKREIQARWSAIFQVPKERFDCCKPQIACTDSVTAFLFQVIEKVEDEIDGNLLDLDLAGPNAKPVRYELNEQRELLVIIVDCVLAGPLVARQMLSQKQAEMWGQVGH